MLSFLSRIRSDCSRLLLSRRWLSIETSGDSRFMYTSTFRFTIQCGVFENARLRGLSLVLVFRQAPMHVRSHIDIALGIDGYSIDTFDHIPDYLLH